METLACALKLLTWILSKNEEKSKPPAQQSLWVVKKESFSNLSVSEQAKKKGGGGETLNGVTTSSLQPIYTGLSLLKSEAALFEESWWEKRSSPDSVLWGTGMHGDLQDSDLDLVWVSWDPAHLWIEHLLLFITTQRLPGPELFGGCLQIILWYHTPLLFVLPQQAF